VTEPSDFVSVPVAAERLGVAHSTIVRWVLHGIVCWVLHGYLQGTQEAPGSRWRISASEVDRVARELGR
jgi:predicted site-specific integrase-resolvase